MKKRKGDNNCGRYGLLSIDDDLDQDIFESALEKEEIKYLQHVFDIYDADKDGEISVDSCVEILRALLGKYISRRDVEHELLRLNMTESFGDVSMQFFVQLLDVYGFSKKDLEKSERRAFTLFDRNEKGYVTFDDMRINCKEGPEDILIEKEEIELMKETFPKIFNEGEKIDGNSTIYFHDFQDLIRR